MPAPNIPAGKDYHMPDAGSVSMPDNGRRSSVDDQRVPLSEKIPVAQTARGSHINPVVDKLMKERNKNMQSEKTLEELNREEEISDGFEVKKQTVDVSSFDAEGEQEIVLNFEAGAKGKKHQKDDDGAYYDVFKDDTL